MIILTNQFFFVKCLKKPPTVETVGGHICLKKMLSDVLLYLLNSVVNDVEKFVNVHLIVGIQYPTLRVDDVNIERITPIKSDKNVPLVVMPVHLEAKPKVVEVGEP